ncbi:PTS transporter subunit EIIB [Brachyspira hampsonii]|uniref:PTS system, IIabc component n=1 Tax=Brachyspira hampsonii 30446 TaxID=1289135 RepID=A0A2U4FFK4_9SPIR|nr:PTS transporter subunit EIIB [Brachyspira hampsonii]EKV55941.1 PTS system, IIabc component [Brachyspira hampsonii 30446]MBW5390157.1 PTS sugar transporter subunit IIABC [Brachyspira hampsonii]MBW5396097.1 PTS sugar transporter subunit IIABC [Brachyspira hampsonii]OEJ19711.1 PTS sugar transporter subunit IIABC [Brachyspira hampsonii]
MELDYKKIAEDIISEVGKDNIELVSYCATRLRLIVKNREQIKDAEIEKIEGVVGVFYNSGQYQIVLSKYNVIAVYDEMAALGIRTL